MSKIALFLVFWGFTFAASSQVDTIYLHKQEIKIYRCTNKSARFWYLKQTDNDFLLVNLTIAQEDILDWFDRYSNSQNLYRSPLILRNRQEFLFFKKPNSPDERLSFEIIRRTNEEIVTQSMETGEEFCFSLLEF